VAKGQGRADSRRVRIHLYFFGKPRDLHANALAEDYLRRVSHYAKAAMSEMRSIRADPWAKHPSAYTVCLDPAGKRFDSAAFTGLVERSEREARDLVFVVGGADGLPPGWGGRASLLLSLSPMTYPHELARAMLAEQIYRAFTTLRGHPYPR
jgi:23S rRNA (pseudouridine1915-N3)-methyltransferase